MLDTALQQGSTWQALASFREAVAKLRRDAGGPLDDDSVLLLMARYVLAGPADDGRANYQVAITVCETCARATQTGLGEALQISSEVAEMARWDAQQIKRTRSERSAASRIGGHGETRVGDQTHVGEETHLGGELSRGRQQGIAGSGPERASQTIPPAVRRAVLRRDQHRGDLLIEKSASGGPSFRHADGTA